MKRGDPKTSLAWNEVPQNKEELAALVQSEQGQLSEAEERHYTLRQRFMPVTKNRHSGVPGLEKGVVVESKLNHEHFTN